MRISHLVGFLVAAAITAAAMVSAANQLKPSPDARLASFVTLQN